MAINDKYIICPLPIVAELLADGEAWTRILDCGFYYRAMNLSYNYLSTAKRELIRCFCFHRDWVPDELIEKYCNIEEGYYSEDDLKCDEDGEDNDEMEQLVEELDDIFMETEGCHMPDDVDCWYKCYMLRSRLELNKEYIPHLIKEAKQWFYANGRCRYEGCPTILISSDTVLKNYKARNIMSEEQRALWTMYMAILSIIGNKKYVSTTSNMIKARMVGANSSKDLKEKLQAMPKARRLLYEKYTSRRHYEHLMLDLQLSHMIVEYGAHRHTYISTKLSLKDLINQVTINTRSERAKRLSEEKMKVKAEIDAAIRAGKIKLNAAKPEAQNAGTPADPLDF